MKSQPFIIISALQWFFERNVQEGHLIEFNIKGKEIRLEENNIGLNDHFPLRLFQLSFTAL